MLGLRNFLKRNRSADFHLIFSRKPRSSLQNVLHGSGWSESFRVRRGQNVLLYQNDVLHLVKPKNINGKFHILHPETISGGFVEDKKHSLVSGKTLCPPKSPLPKRWCIGYKGFHLNLSYRNWGDFESLTFSETCVLLRNPEKRYKGQHHKDGDGGYKNLFDTFFFFHKHTVNYETRASSSFPRLPPVRTRRAGETSLSRHEFRNSQKHSITCKKSSRERLA